MTPKHVTIFGGPARAAQPIGGRLNEPFPTSGEPMKHTALSAAPESAGAW